MRLKQPLLLSVFVVVLLVVTFIVRGVVLHGGVARLGQAPPLAGAVSKGIASSRPDNSLPQFGKDYTLKNIRYFYNKQWAVTTVVLLRIKTDDAIVVIHMVNGTYQVMLGPGTAFPNNYLQGLPTDVAEYLINQGVIYEPATN